ncbi:hypothetical protein Hanom_Chr12g01103151 [Helianthus anomalus]
MLGDPGWVRDTLVSRVEQYHTLPPLTSTTRGRVDALWWSRVEVWNFVYGGLYSSAEELYTDGINKKGCDTITSDTTPLHFYH